MHPAGLVHFLKAPCAELEQLWRPANLGKRFSSVAAGHSQVVGLKYGHFLFGGKNAAQEAVRAIDGSAKFAEGRRELVPYLAQFAQHFEREPLLDFLTMFLLNEVPREDVERVFGAMQHEGFESDEVQFWLYDLMTGRLDYDHATQFYQFIGGIVREPDTPSDDLSLMEAATPPVTSITPVSIAKHTTAPCVKTRCERLPSSSIEVPCRWLPSTVISLGQRVLLARKPNSAEGSAPEDPEGAR